MGSTVPSSGEISLGKSRAALASGDIGSSTGGDYDAGPVTDANLSLAATVSGSGGVTQGGLVDTGEGVADAANAFVNPGPNVNQSMSEMRGFRAATVLCTELYEQGKLKKDVYRRDKEMTDTWMAKRPLLKAGYLCAAHWPLWLLRNKKQFAEKYMHYIIIAFSNFYADKHHSAKKKHKKNNWVGKSMMIFGLIIFPPLGLATKVSKNKNYRLVLSTITTISWFMPLFIYSIVLKGIKKITGE
tara:strand:- start:4827 stop:5555 length:729 start_codon:yes stop_codon:yes gene_type:complete